MGSEPTDTSDSSSDIDESNSAPRDRASIAAAARRALRTRQPPEQQEPPEPVTEAAPVTEAEPVTKAEPGPAAEAQPATRLTRTATIAEPARTAHPPRPGGSAVLGRTAVLVLAAVAALAVAFVVVSAVWLARAKPSGDVQFANARDAVLVDAQKDIETLNGVDYRAADKGLDAWLDVSTGTLHDQIVQQRQSVITQVVQAKTVTSAHVLAAAVSTVDDRSGTATVIASVEQTVTPAGKPAAKKRDRFAVDMSRTGGSWKISSITLVPV